jgi:hypothetical protein
MPALLMRTVGVSLVSGKGERERNGLSSFPYFDRISSSVHLMLSSDVTSSSRAEISAVMPASRSCEMASLPFWTLRAPRM